MLLYLCTVNDRIYGGENDRARPAAAVTGGGGGGSSPGCQITDPPPD